MNARQYPAAKKQLETALNTSEKLGLQVLQARSQYLLGRTLELSGSGTEAAGHYAAGQEDAARNSPGIGERCHFEATRSGRDFCAL